eukprot:scaffold430064_cov28-Prasinocladus_malaysianus.AAC.1
MLIWTLESSTPRSRSTSECGTGNYDLSWPSCKHQPSSSSSPRSGGSQHHGHAPARPDTVLIGGRPSRVSGASVQWTTTHAFRSPLHQSLRVADDQCDSTQTRISVTV